MAVLANALFLALISVASATDSADCGAQDATSLIQMKSILEQGKQKKVSAKDEDKKVCTPPHYRSQGAASPYEHGDTVVYAQCLQNNCEDSSYAMVGWWTHGGEHQGGCKGLTTSIGCDSDADLDFGANLSYSVVLPDMKVWKMCGATCKEQCNAARLEKKVIAEDEDKATCTPPEYVMHSEDDTMGSSSKHFSGAYGGNTQDYGNTADYAQCLENSCEDAESTILRHWSGGHYGTCSDVKKIVGCEPRFVKSTAGRDLWGLHNNKVWKMCGATCKEQCNAAQLEKKEESSPKAGASIEEICDEKGDCHGQPHQAECVASSGKVGTCVRGWAHSCYCNENRGERLAKKTAAKAESSPNAVANIEKQICSIDGGALRCRGKSVGSECEIKGEVRSCVKRQNHWLNCACLKEESSPNAQDVNSDKDDMNAARLEKKVIAEDEDEEEGETAKASPTEEDAGYTDAERTRMMTSYHLSGSCALSCEHGARLPGNYICKDNCCKWIGDNPNLGDHYQCRNGRFTG